MAKVLIVYQSKTGNTAAMAEAVEEGVRKEGVEVIRKKIEEASLNDLLEPDGIIIGSAPSSCITSFLYSSGGMGLLAGV